MRAAQSRHLPCTPEQLAPDWLTDALRQSGTLVTAEVTTLTWEIIGQEWGFTGVIARLWPRYSSSPSRPPASLIAKFPMAQQLVPSEYQRTASRDDVARRRRYQRSARELSFYQNIAPGGRAPVPQLYFGDADPDSGCIVLLLEDLHEGIVGDALQGCSPDEANAVLQVIAPFHAQWWDNPPLDTLLWLPRWGHDLPQRAQRYSQAVEPFLARFEESMPSGTRALLVHLVDAYLPSLSELANAPTTVIHGDLHLDNVIFGAPGRDVPAWLLDWQSVIRGPAVLDLTLIANSLPVKTRRKSESSLLAGYQKRLVAEGVAGYPLELLKHHYHLALLAHLSAVVTWLATVNLEGLVGRERALVEASIADPTLLIALLDHYDFG